MSQFPTGTCGGGGGHSTQSDYNVLQMMMYALV